jgi:hypothetical protein
MEAAKWALHFRTSVLPFPDESAKFIELGYQISCNGQCCLVAYIIHFV